MTLLSNSKDCPHCGSDHTSRPYCVYVNGTFCFACGHRKISDRSFSQSKRLVSSELVSLPEFNDNPSTFSLESLQWLYQYYIYEDLIRSYRIVETAGPSLLFPVLKDNDLIMYQQRRMDRKYITTNGPKTYMYSKTPECDTLVIVEDFISCVRVGEVYPSLCLFGTSLSYEEQQRIVEKYRRIVLWLDPDEAGQTAAKKIGDSLNKIISKYMNKYAFAVREQKTIENNLTNNQPKCYTKSILGELLNEKKIV